MRKCAENHLDELSRRLDKSKRHAFGRTLRHPAHIDSMNLLHVAGGAKRSAAQRMGGGFGVGGKASVTESCVREGYRIQGVEKYKQTEP